MLQPPGQQPHRRPGQVQALGGGAALDIRQQHACITGPVDVVHPQGVDAVGHNAAEGAEQQPVGQHYIRLGEQFRPGGGQAAPAVQHGPAGHSQIHPDLPAGHRPEPGQQPPHVVRRPPGVGGIGSPGRGGQRRGVRGERRAGQPTARGDQPRPLAVAAGRKRGGGLRLVVGTPGQQLPDLRLQAPGRGVHAGQHLPGGGLPRVGGARPVLHQPGAGQSGGTTGEAGRAAGRARRPARTRAAEAMKVAASAARAGRAPSTAVGIPPAAEPAIMTVSVVDCSTARRPAGTGRAR